MKNKTRVSQEKIYKDLYDKHRGTSMAVSSESWEHKKLRFSQISDLFKDEENIEIHDVGMGLSAFYEFLKTTYPDRIINYSGTEILKDYVDDSIKLFPECKFYLRDLAEVPGNEKYDYLILSGIFHQRRDTKISEWENFAKNIIRNSFSMCKKGIAFNMISPFVDFYQTQVYYANLLKFINFIVDDLSRFYEIKHNYALFEFTVFVYTEDYIKGKYPQAEFKKYFKN